MFSPSQLLELFVILRTAYQFAHTVSTVRSALAYAQSKSGLVRPDTVPTGLFSILFNAFQLSVTFLNPAIYMVTIAIAGLQQPHWMNAFALPEVDFDVRLEGFSKIALRLLACAGVIAVQRIVKSMFGHLGDQYHSIGVRSTRLLCQVSKSDFSWPLGPSASRETEGRPDRSVRLGPPSALWVRLLMHCSNWTSIQTDIT